jgi:hypothetical protein
LFIVNELIVLFQIVVGLSKKVKAAGNWLQCIVCILLQFTKLILANTG